MQIKLVPIATLSHDNKNARSHTQRNLDAIIKSLEQFGQRKPIVVHNNVVIAGNGTLEAAKALNWDEITITEVPSDWDTETAKAYAIADNRSSELAEWDFQNLYETLAELTEADALEYTGFSQAEFDELQRQIEGTTEGQFDRNAEWVGMPEFEQPNKNSYFHTVIHFTNEENANAFFDLINRPKRKTFWWPVDDGLVGADKDFHYVTEK